MAGRQEHALASPEQAAALLDIGHLHPGVSAVAEGGNQVAVVLKTHIGQGTRMVGRMVHVPVELLLEVPVVGGVADD